MIRNAAIISLSAVVIMEGAFLYALKMDSVKKISSMKEVNDIYTKDIEELKKELARLKTAPTFVNHGVPYISQAPFSNWNDPKQAYGCEEASVLMAIAWARNEALPPDKGLKEITAISNYQLEQFNNFYDTSIQDTYERIILGYFKYNNARVQVDPNIEDIRQSLAKGNLVIAPVNGQTLANKYYTPPGPFLHTLLIIGYDDITKEFITHDPGTTYGNSARYSYEKMALALQDYESGFNQPIKDKSSIIIISKESS